ncbi:uncharacterized protein TRUGW13939_00020 [Talaromyces rugulosus]|uniref:Zn(2)-C6 fungal-type domain-containing protein n=1 Tax=Talaromyces rugulosus TaxID=121627 RepID=A0A7H8QGE1_TALRU|nr:uncharacterized protein TRUGW13939_00020 [Talaromyces rugulosus]QKX52949.1 hypothetical protein TRUGW13939_00020 [Talaromyces rugulosus]
MGSQVLREFGPDAEIPCRTVAKTRRTAKACLQCRSRKQKCGGQSIHNRRRSCSRCLHLGFTCSFLTQPYDNDTNYTAYSPETAEAVEKLRTGFDEHETRLRYLESLINDFKDNTDPTQETPSVSNIQSNHSVSEGPQGTQELLDSYSGNQHIIDPIGGPAEITADRVALRTVNLDAPITTLRHLHPYGTNSDIGNSMVDPVSCGFIHMGEAQEACDVFFANCHRWGPVLCPRSQRSAEVVRKENPVLFTSICAVGFRFMGEPRRDVYKHIVALLDAMLSRLLLQPTSADVKLDHIKALLLYIQWMPLDSSQYGASSSRYNDISSWSMLGLAIRYALLMGMHQSAVVPFSNQGHQVVTQEDILRLRV